MSYEIVRVNISRKQILFNNPKKIDMKKQKQIITLFFNHPLTEAYLNLNQDAFKHNKIRLP